MPKLLGQVKPRGFLKWWGWFRFMWMHMTFYFSMSTFALVLINTFYETIGPWIQLNLGFSFPFWGFIILFVLGFGVGLILEFKYSVPDRMTAQMSQQYKYHPMRKDLQDVQKDVKEIRELVKKLSKGE